MVVEWMCRVLLQRVPLSLQVLMAVTASPRPKQVLLFSATMPAALERLARSAVLNPVSGSHTHHSYTHTTHTHSHHSHTHHSRTCTTHTHTPLTHMHHSHHSHTHTPLTHTHHSHTHHSHTHTHTPLTHTHTPLTHTHTTHTPLTHTHTTHTHTTHTCHAHVHTHVYAHTCTPDVAGADFYSVLPLQLVIQTGVRGLTAQNLLQEVLFLHSYQKQGRLLEVLRSTQQPPVLVFANSISTVNEVTRLLREEQFHVAGLHSEMEQSDRFTVMAAFRKGERGGSLPS